MSGPTPTRWVATIATAAVSVLAVVLAVAYLVAPARTALAIEVARDASIKVPAAKILIYGKASDYRSKPLADVRVVIASGRKTKLKLVSRGDGTFQKASSLKSGKYVMSVSRKSKGKTRTAKASIRLARGRAYRVTVRLVRSGGLTILPIRAY